MTARTRAPSATNNIELEQQPVFVGTVTSTVNRSVRGWRRCSPSG